MNAPSLDASSGPRSAAFVWQGDVRTRRLTFVSPAFADVLGHDPDAWIGRPDYALEHVHPDDRARVRAVRESAAADGGDYAVRYRAEDAQGRGRRLYETGARVPGPDGPLLAGTTTVDAPEALRRVDEARYRALFEAAADVVLVYRVGPQGPEPLLDFNEAAVAFYDYSADELRSLRVSDLVDPASISVPDALAQLREQGTARFESVHRTRDGRRIPVETLAHLFELDGHPTILSLCRDVRARHEAQQRQARLAALVEASEDAITRQDLDGTVTDWSPSAEALYGYAADEIVGRSIERIVPEDRVEETRGLLTRAARGEPVRGFETMRHHRDGALLPISLTLSPIYDARGEVVGISTVERDISERRRSERRLRLLAEAGAVLGTSLEYEETLARVAHLAVPELADWCAIDLLDDDGTLRRVAVVHVDTEKVRLAHELWERYPPDPDEPVGASHVVRTGEPDVFTDLSDEVLRRLAQDEEHYRLIESLGLRSGITVPLAGRRQVLGALTLVTAESGRRLDEDDLPFVRELAERCALAIEHARLFRAMEEEVADRRRAEASLRDASGQLRVALDAADLGTWSYDFAGGTVYWDERSRRIFGVPQHEALDYDRVIGLMHPDDRERVDTAVGAALDPAGPGTYDVEYRVRHDDGAVRWVAARGQAFFGGEDAERRPTRFAGTMMDVTERKRSEKALRASEARFRSLFESMTEGVVYHDAEGRIIDANPAAERLLGLSLAQLQGREPADERWRTTDEHGEPFAGQDHPAATALRTGQVVQDVVMGVYHPRRDEQRWLVVDAVPEFRPGEERPYRAYALFDDVTDQRRAERRIRRSEHRFRTLVEATAAIVWTTPASGELEGEQPDWAAYTGQALDTYQGWGWLDAVHPEDRAATTRAWNAALEARAPYEVEHRLRRHDGVYRHMLVRAAPVVEDGVIREWVGTHTDITHLKEAEAAMARAAEAAEAANRAKSQFLANMSHELRTPLNAVIGYSELLEEEAEDAGMDAFLPELDKIHAAGKQLLALVNDVLDLSKIEAGRVELRLASFEVEPLVHEVAAAVEPLVDKNSNTMEVYVDEAIGTMHADETKVRQGLFNLLGNAAKFTDGGRVRLDVEQAEEQGRPWILFRVEDTGIGMTEEQKEQLFQSFYRGELEGSEHYEGTGLGLAITWRLCEMMGGTIEVESERGEGSVFTLRLPAHVGEEAADRADRPDRPEPAAAEVASAVDGETVSPSPGCGPVLVIDDEEDARELVRRYLEREGFNVATASGGREGLRLARLLRPAAITLDVIMPDMDGWDVLSAIKSDPELADTPVIMLTMVQGRRRAYALGAVEYMPKPVDRDRLSVVLHRLCTAPGDCRILVVDDDPTTRGLVRRTLEPNGFCVAEASNGREALTHMIEQPPHVILLDLMMPEMDGFAFVEELRKHDDWRRIPVVVLTAKDLSPAERRRLNGYVQTILQKGDYSRNQLLHEIHTRIADAIRSGEK